MSKLFYKSNLRPSSSERDWWPNWFSWAYFYSNLILYAKPQRQIPSREIDKPTFSPIKVHSQLYFRTVSRKRVASSSLGQTITRVVVVDGLSSHYPCLFWHNITRQVDYIDFTRVWECLEDTFFSFLFHPRTAFHTSFLLCMPVKRTRVNHYIRWPCKCNRPPAALHSKLLIPVTTWLLFAQNADVDDDEGNFWLDKQWISDRLTLFTYARPFIRDDYWTWMTYPSGTIQSLVMSIHIVPRGGLPSNLGVCFQCTIFDLLVHHVQYSLIRPEKSHPDLQ